MLAPYFEQQCAMLFTTNREIAERWLGMFDQYAHIQTILWPAPLT